MINAHVGCFDNNVQELRETLVRASNRHQLDDSLIVLHPYALSGAEPHAEAEHPQFQLGIQRQLESLESVRRDSQRLLTMYSREQQWIIHFRDSTQEMQCPLKNGDLYVTMEQEKLVVTTDTLLKSILEDDNALIYSNFIWVVFLLDAYSRETVQRRRELLERLQQKVHAPVILIGAVGVANDRVHAGDTALFLPNTTDYGFALESQYALIDLFQEAITWEIDRQQVYFIQPDIEKEHAIILFAIRDFITKSGFSRVHLGLSGGVDSSLVAALVTQAIGANNVVGILMPSPYSSQHSITDALELAKNLNIETHMISLDDIYYSLKILLNKDFAISNLADENMQARLRGLYLMTYANSTNSFLLTTGNKSEIACGYGTLYGDMCGSYNPIGDLYKTEVYDLCRYINHQAGCNMIPEHVLTKAPSAELRMGQFDQETLPEYTRLDRIIELLLQNKYTHEQVASHSETTIEEVLHVANLLRKSEFKRWQAPPVLKLRDTHLGSSRGGVLLSTFKG